ncbi:MAG: murein biosynthesis integral membrane protein MurJ [Rhodospirillales bacterium]
MPLVRSIATIGGLTSVSRVFGFVRDILIASMLGAGMAADAFFVAFKFPNLFRRLFAEGAFSAAFVPIFAGALETEGRERARAFAEQALGVLVPALLLFVTAMQIAMPVAMYGMAPGFAASPEKFDLAVLFSRITFPYLLFISVVSLMAGVLNSLGRFAAAAAAPILLNLCLILALVGLSPLTASPGHALAWGVAAAGVIQFAWLLVACGRAGVWLRLPRPRLTPRVRQLMRRALPVAIGAGIYQINLLLDTIIASLLPSGSISFLFYADRVNQLPLGIVGVAVGTALLPVLSRQVRAGHADAALHSQNRALEIAFLFTLPAAAALLVIAGPVISVLFERGEFGPAEARATAMALAAYATGLPAYVLAKALTPGYFAREDTVTPVRIAAVTTVVNLLLNLLLMGPFLHVGIAVATSVSSWLNAGLLALILYRRGFLRIDARLAGRLPRMLLASAVMAAVLVLLQVGLADWLAAGLARRAAALAVLVGIGAATFAAAAQLTGAAGLSDLRRLMRGRDIA